MSERASGKIRLQKFLSEAGVAARREAEGLVLEGRVTINGHVVDGLPAFVDPEEDDVRVDGDPVRAAPKVYYLLNKPKGTVVSNDDPSGRKKVGDLLVGVRARVYPVGRLEMDGDGVLLMTNDGQLAEKLTHPRYGVEKVFRVEVKGQVAAEDLLKIRKGMWLSEGRTAEAWVDVTFTSRELTIVEIRMRESRHRQIPRMLARLGYKIKKLTCIRIGRLTTKGLRAGEYRPLTAEEVRHLLKLAQKVTADADASAGGGLRPMPPRPRRKMRRPVKADKDGGRRADTAQQPKQTGRDKAQRPTAKGDRQKRPPR
jgi:23S rRNA pseudouridine2605 synthase